MEEKKHRWFLILLILIGFLLRVYKVSSYPSLLWDEASLGYNAYSILKTGRDEYGKFLPIIFKSFGDYKPGLYVYLAIPSIAIFGLNEFAVRLPSVILGALTPLFIYLLIKEIFKSKRLALFSALAMVFLPWQIHFSKGAWESNVLVSFIILASYFFFKSLRPKIPDLKSLFFSSLFFLFSLWTYQGAKMVVPLVIFGLLIFNYRQLIAYFKKGNFLRTSRHPERSEGSRFFGFQPQNDTDRLSPVKIFFGNKERIIGIGILLIAFLMALWYVQSFSGAAKNRLKVMSLFSYQRPAEEIKMILSEDDQTIKNLHFYIFHGEWLHFTRGFLTRYFNHFSPRYLAFDGDWSNPRHSAPYFGAIGHVNLVLFVLGLGLFLSKKHKFKKYFLLYWLLVSPLPAAFSRDIISGVRSLPMVVPIAFFIGYGLVALAKIKIANFRLAIFAFLFLAAAIDFIYYLDLYYYHMVARSPKDWLYGHKEAISFIRENNVENGRVLMTNFYGQPHIFYLFYSKYPPQEYQRQARLVENEFGDVGQIEKIDNLVFKSLNWQTALTEPDALIIFSQDEILRSGVDKDQSVLERIEPLGIINNQALFYGFKNVKTE